MSLLDRRVLVVTGKGGVGKTTVSILLALRAARAGLRVALCELSGSNRAPLLFGVAPKPYTLQRLTTGLEHLSITPEGSMEDYLLRIVKFKALYQAVFRNQVMGPFLDAVPGLHDLIQLGKVWDMERTRVDGRCPWDLIVVDGPATGHGLTLLSAPRKMMDLTVAGPFFENAKAIASLVEDPARTSLVLVSTPEELPVQETIELVERLGPKRAQVAAVLLNEIHPDVLPDLSLYRQHRSALAHAPALTAALDAADAIAARQAGQALARERLRALGLPLRELPFLFHRDLRLEQLAPLGRLLEGL